MIDMFFLLGVFFILVVDDDVIFCDLVLVDLVSKYFMVVVCYMLEDVKEVVFRYYFDIMIIDNYLFDGEGVVLIFFL